MQRTNAHARALHDAPDASTDNDDHMKEVTHMPRNTADKNAALAEAADNGDAEVQALTFIDELPEKPKVARTNWWAGIAPQLDAQPGRWAPVYTGTGDNPSRNALSRSVRTKRLLKDANDTRYEFDKRDEVLYARRKADVS